MSKMFIGHPSEFNPANDDWDIFERKLRSFFSANEIDETKKRDILLSLLNQVAYKLIIDLSVPDKPESKTYDDLVALLKEHYSPKVSVFKERYVFYKAQRNLNESISDWAARVQHLAASCNFREHLSFVILEKFVMGLEDGKVKERLFSEDPSTLTLARAKEIAHQVIEASQLFVSAETNIKTESEMFRIKPERSTVKVGCRICGFKNHQTEQCRFKDYTCNSCGIKGHLSKVCKKKAFQSKPQRSEINHMVGEKIEEIQNTADKINEGILFSHLFNLNNGNEETHPPYGVCIKINDYEFQAIIDSGSTYSAISDSHYHRFFYKVPLQQSNEVIRFYQQDYTTSPLGTSKLKVTYNSCVHEINFRVIPNAFTTVLLGRDFMQRFGFNVTQVNSLVFSEYKKKLSVMFPKVCTEELGVFNKCTFHLKLKPDAVPKFCQPRRPPYALRNKIEEELDRLLNLKIISPVSYSEWATPIVAVLKPNGSLRICGDFKTTLNPFLELDRHPLPRPEDIFASLHGATVFSKVDLSSAYAQLMLDPESRKLSTISTHKGLFAYNRVPYGISPAPQMFQKVIEMVVAGLEGCVAFQDDIIVSGHTLEEHNIRLYALMNRLEDHGLTINIEKSEFTKPSVSYLGYVLSKEGLALDKGRIQGILEMLPPTSVSELKSFLGMVEYYRRFLDNASTTLYPLYCLLKKGTPWIWSNKCTVAFTKLKNQLSKAPVLAHYDPSKDIILTVDASPYAVSAVLNQREKDGKVRPIGFASKVLTPTQQKYPQIHKEAYAIVFGIQKFSNYLFLRKFSLETDHKPLLAIFGPKKGIPVLYANRLQHYAIFLENYNFDIKFIESHKNCADFLSRAVENKNKQVDDVPSPPAESSLFFCKFKVVTAEMIAEHTERDKVLRDLKLMVTKGWVKNKRPELQLYKSVFPELSILDGCLVRGHKLIVPSSLRPIIIKELHSSHFGVVKTKLRAKDRFWWPNISKDIENYVLKCHVCRKCQDSPPKSELQPWPWPNHPWDRIHIDFLGPLYGTSYLIIVDAHSKWLEVLPMKSTTSLATVSALRKIFARFGLPKVIVSDNGTQLVQSQEYKDFCLRNGIAFKSGAPYHPQTNGQAENSVRLVKRIITKIKESEQDLNQALDNFLLAYRTTPHVTTGVSPANLMFGRDLRTRLDCLKIQRKVNYEQIKNEAAERVAYQQNAQKLSSGNRTQIFNIGQPVWVKKGSSKIWEPASIVKVFGGRHYLVKLCNSGKFLKKHLDQLRTYVGSTENEVFGKEAAPVYEEAPSPPEVERESSSQELADTLPFNQLQVGRPLDEEENNGHSEIELPLPLQDETSYESPQLPPRKRRPPRRLTYSPFKK